MYLLQCTGYKRFKQRPQHAFERHKGNKTDLLRESSSGGPMHGPLQFMQRHRSVVGPASLRGRVCLLGTL